MKPETQQGQVYDDYTCFKSSSDPHLGGILTEKHRFEEWCHFGGWSRFSSLNNHVYRKKMLFEKIAPGVEPFS